MQTVFTAPFAEGIQCLLCPHTCRLEPQTWGRCGVRQNMDNKVIAQNYARVAAAALDPVEKKPLYHFYPGKYIFSAGTFGCNFNCAFCQNWQLVHAGEKGENVSPEKLAHLAGTYMEQGNIGIAYTYSEPLMWYEYVRDTAIKAKQKGLKNVLVTNGFINPKPLEELLPYIDAANIDVKSFNKEFYERVVGGELQVVLRNVERFKKAGVHVELTFLMVTSLNDSYQESRSMIKWIKETVGKETPLHISRYFPNYKLKLPATPVESMEQVYLLAKEELDYVYLGNVNTDTAKDTYCPVCGARLISRGWAGIVITGLEKSQCVKCGAAISGVFE